MSACYSELRSIAARFMRGERAGHLLQTTALVNEAYLRLVQARDRTLENRAQFFSLAATLMRRILIDFAREAQAAKRGGRPEVVPLDVADASVAERPVEILALEDVLQKLEKHDRRAARVIELRFFGGLSMEETAIALGVTERTVRRDWTFGRAWLRDRLEEQPCDEATRPRQAAV